MLSIDVCGDEIDCCAVLGTDFDLADSVPQVKAAGARMPQCAPFAILCALSVSLILLPAPGRREVETYLKPEAGSRETPHMKHSVLLVALWVVFVAGCAAPPGITRAPQVSQVRAGMTKDEVILTLGKPNYGFSVNGEDTLIYFLERPSQESRPFEVKLSEGLVQSYGVRERDPAKVDPRVARFEPEMAVPWYSANDYERVLILLPAAERADAISYDEWVERTTLVEQEIRNIGYVPVRVPVQAVELEGWCKYHSVGLNRTAIAAFTEMRLGLERGRGGRANPAEDPKDDFLEKLLVGFSARN